MQNDVSTVGGWVLFLIISGAVGVIAYKLKRGEAAEQELKIKEYEDEKRDTEDANSKLTPQQLADKNNSR